MNKIAFDNQRYIELQSQMIQKRIQQFDNKLYLEFGGKLFDDFHASRVLPGFEPDSKIKMLMSMKDKVEVLIVISANDIEKNKIRGDLGITYDQDVLRLIDAFNTIGLFVSHVVITQYASQKSVDVFKEKLKNLGIKTALHYPIEGYPVDVTNIVSDNGFGKNDYIETTRELVVITAPGPGSGKMATCLSQLYHDYKHGVKAGYAKFETFPIWNLSLKHPVNLAYEAATADLNDVNMIDPFHLEAYNIQTVNYNRDVEVFPVLNAIFERIQGKSPYKSPTDMGVNMAGYCIQDDDVACAASKNEILRRYYEALCNQRIEGKNSDEVNKIEMIMNQAGITKNDRPCVAAACKKAEITGAPAACIELNDGTLVTGKTTPLLGACSAALLNALKILGNINDDLPLISPSVIEPICRLKIDKLGNHNPRLHMDETLIALAISAQNNPLANHAVKQLEKLRGCEVHSSVILNAEDRNIFKKLKMNLTCEPQYQTKKYFHKK